MRNKTAEEMLRFIEKSPTPYQAVENLSRRFADAGFAEVKETEDWQGENGLPKKFFVTRNGSAMMAVKLPKTGMPKGFHIAAAHCDSPTFRVKENPEMASEGCYTRLNTEKYGGMILSTWLDRPLSVAGRIVADSEEGVKAIPVNIDRDLCVIPNLAVHMNRGMNDGYAYNPQTDMLPLFGNEACAQGGFLKVVAEAAGVAPEDILAHDLFLYTRQPGTFVGPEDEFVVSPRLDDLQCVFSAAEGFLAAEPEEYVNICAVFDNEEVGSGTKQGADSTFLSDVLARVAESYGMCESEYERLVAGSFLISADNGHAVHPAHPEKADPTNRPHPNGGIVIKYHGAQKYTTDGVSAARMKKICQKAGVPFQIYTNRSDIVGGSTLGNISTSHVSVSSVDIGLAQLAMHSAVETGGAADTEYAVKAFTAFFEE